MVRLRPLPIVSHDRVGLKSVRSCQKDGMGQTEEAYEVTGVARVELELRLPPKTDESNGEKACESG